MRKTPEKVGSKVADLIRDMGGLEMSYTKNISILHIMENINKMTPDLKLRGFRWADFPKKSCSINIKRIYGFFAIVFSTLFLISFSAYGADYVVSQSGSDGNNGTLASPWKTIGKANKTLKPGDTVLIRTGVYDEEMNPANSGLPGLPISYKAFPGEAPVIDRSRILSNWQQLNGSVYFASYPAYAAGVWEDTFEQSGDYYRYWPQSSLSGVTGPGKYYVDVNNSRVYVWTKNGDDPKAHIMRTSIGNGAGFTSKEYIIVDGILIKWVQNAIKLNNSNYCVFRKIAIQYAAGYGIFLAGPCNYNTIAQNTISYVGGWYWYEGDGIYVNGHHNLVDGNNISFAGHNAINSNGKTSATYNNIIQNNKAHDIGKSAFGSNYNTHHEVWRNNLSYRSRGAGIQIDSNNTIVHGNIFYGNGLGLSIYATDNRSIYGNRVYNNTMYNNYNTSAPEVTDIRISEYSGICSDNVFKNNISYKTNVEYQLFIDGLQVRNNLFSHNNVVSDKQAQVRVLPTGVKTLAGSQDNYPLNFVNNMQLDPLFVNASGGNFILKSGSGCIDKGTFLTKVIGSGSGRIIVVQDAGYFCDGFGITAGDTIQLEGTAGRVGILKVDYDTNTIEIDRETTWKDSAGVSLSYSGSAPDIGALEYSLLPPPKVLKVITP